MKARAVGHGPMNVYNIFTGRLVGEKPHVVRLAPEFEGLEMLYSNDTHPDKLYSLKIVAWALLDNDEVVGMVPWLGNIVPGPDINDPLNGRWEGYRDPRGGDIFYHAPLHKIAELEAAARFYGGRDPAPMEIIQEIPDSIGTHAVLTGNGFASFTLVEVLSWRLLGDGRVLAMLVDEKKITTTPVLPGDPCLFPAQEHPDFRYFFQHRIANKIKEQDPEALAAISMLIEP